ncbi:MAG TPA: methyltransferase domain-containing protein [Candidatus Binatia bacterium]|jgi:phospholipid N-methyltransferase|nr:methyltransferase domain-containing protein [Candidatus Binatia bacterium]
MNTAAKHKVSFFREFLKDRHVAAVHPSSPHLMRRLLKRLDLASTRLLIELGPGEGVAMRAILPKLAPDARYVAIERNPTFAAALQSYDPRATVIQGRAQDLEKLLPGDVGRADAVIASIPFTYLKKEERDAVVASAKKMLRPGGTLVVFHQYSPLMVPYLAKRFEAVHVEFEALNVFPCFLMAVTKDEKNKE